MLYLHFRRLEVDLTVNPRQKGKKLFDCWTITYELRGKEVRGFAGWFGPFSWVGDWHPKGSTPGRRLGLDMDVLGVHLEM